jgi:hypothetical protein
VVKLSAVIMAHQKRAHFVEELKGQLDRELEVVWDRRGDRWDTGARAMMTYDPTAQYHLVIQDDAVPCRDLLAGTEKALSSLPEDDSAVALYAGRVRPFREQVARVVEGTTEETSWLRLDLHWGVGIIMPTRLIPEMVRWGNRHTRTANYDKRVSRWLRLKRVPTYYTWPSLVDHRDSESLVPGRIAKGRTAYQFLGTDNSALEVNWEGGVVSIRGPMRSVNVHSKSEEVKVS